MGEHPDLKLTWHGAETVQAARDAINAGNSVAIYFAASLHHALFERFKPGAGSGTVEQLELSGGTELLDQLAGHPDLRPVAELKDAVQAQRAAVYFVSPAPCLLIEPKRDPA